MGKKGVWSVWCGVGRPQQGRWVVLLPFVASPLELGDYPTWMGTFPVLLAYLVDRGFDGTHGPK